MQIADGAGCMDKPERYFEFDMTRFLPMLGLPFFHILYIALMFDVCDADMNSVVAALGFLRIFGPAIFMIGLGSNIVFSPHASWRNLLIRALVVFAASLILNVLRYIVPAAAVETLTDNTSAMDAAVLGMVTSDILFFAALVFLVFAFIVKFNVRPFYVLVFAACLIVLSDFTSFDPTGNDFLDCIIANFVYIEGATPSYYFIGWFIYPAAGYVLGYTVKKMQRPERSVFYKKLIIISAVIFAAVSAALVANGVDYLKTFNAELNGLYCSFFTVVLNMSVVLAVLGLFYFVIYSVKSEKVLNTIVSVSKRLFCFYMLQWIFVMVAAMALVAVFGFIPFPVWLLMIIAAGILVLSLVLSKPLQSSYLKLMTRLRNDRA